MPIEVERIYLDGIWLGVGGNTPWHIKGRIESIKLYESDPRDFNGSDNSLIKINFDSGYVLRVKTNDYIVLHKEMEGSND